jgi:hypothetical protein
MAYICATRGLDPDIARGLMKYGDIPAINLGML